MPRIPLQDQATRLQVSSPVPIGGTSGARTQGEAVAGFGNDLVKTAANLQDYFKVKDTEEKKIFLGRVENAGTEAKQKAFAAAGKEAKDDGSDMLELYQKKYDDEVKEITKEIDALGGNIAAEAKNVLGAAKNSYAANVYADVTRRGPEALDRARRANYASRASRILSAPDAAIEEIEKNNKEVDQLTGLYTAPVREQIKVDDQASLVDTAVNGFIGQKKFSEAEAALQKLAPYAKDAAHINKLSEKIAVTKLQYTNRVLDEKEQAEKKRKEAYEQVVQNNDSALFAGVAAATSPAQRDVMLQQAQDLLKQRLISPEGYNRLQAEAKDVSGEMESRASVNYTSRILKGESGSKIQKDIMKSFDDGTLTRETTERLLRAAKTASKEKQADPAFKRQVQVSNDIINATVTGSRGQFDFATKMGGNADKERLAAEVINKRNEYMEQGVDPVPAARKALRQMIGAPESLPPLPGIGRDSMRANNMDAVKSTLLQQKKEIIRQFGASEWERRVRLYGDWQQALEVHAKDAQ